MQKQKNRKSERATEQKKMRKALKTGYLKSGAVNLEYAEMCLHADNEALASCEEKLSECE